MTPERWQQIERLCGQAFDLPPAERERFLDQACSEDADLRREVHSLILADRDAGSFILEPALGKRGSLAERGGGKLENGSRIGPFELRHKLGEGGMSTVYLAQRCDGQYDQRVAIKLIRHGMESASHLRRIHVERQILATLDHANIARLFDGGTLEDGRPYFVMEFIDGEPIDEYCDRRRLGVAERLELFRTVCSAVHYAHQNLVVHRDLKPGNILVTAEGVPKLLDFGIAKLLDPDLVSPISGRTRTWQRVLTPEYASPEQVQGEAITTASDVYSLGVLLYRLLTGRLPYRFAGLSLQEIERMLREEEPPKPSQALAGASESVSRAHGGRPEQLRRQLAGDLDHVVLMALRQEPQHRYSSAQQLAADLRRHREGLPVMARRGTRRYRTGKFLRRHRLAVTMAATFLLLVVASTLALASLAARLAQQRDQAQAEREKHGQVATFLEDIFELSDPDKARGETVTAREILDRGAERIERELSGQTETQTSLMVSIGKVYRRLGLYRQAERLLTAALETRRARFGEEHSDVAESLHELGLLRLDLGEYEIAERQVRQALELRRELLGSEHPAVAENLADLAFSLSELGHYDTAEDLAREALELSHAIYGRAHPRVAEVSSLLGAVLLGKGDYPEAERLFRETLSLELQLFGEDNLQVAETLSSLADAITWNRRDYQESQALVERALVIWRKLLGEDHQKILLALNNLATIAADRGDYERAAALYQEALDRAHGILPPEHPKTAYLWIGLGLARVQLGDFKSAERSIRQGFEHRRRTLGSDHFLTVIAENDLGSCLIRLERYKEAEPLLLSSYRAIAASRPIEDRDHQRALRRLGHLYEGWEKPDQAAEYRALLSEDRSES